MFPFLRLGTPFFKNNNTHCTSLLWPTRIKIYSAIQFNQNSSQSGGDIPVFAFSLLFAVLDPPPPSPTLTCIFLKYIPLLWPEIVVSAGEEHGQPDAEGKKGLLHVLLLFQPGLVCSQLLLWIIFGSYRTFIVAKQVHERFNKMILMIGKRHKMIYTKLYFWV